MWRHIQQLGLKSAYHTDQAFHRYCRQLLALPCLPAEVIADTLAELEAEATTEAQHQLCDYIKSTWLQSTVWPAPSWSVFYRRIRSNNDVKGWHRRLNIKANRGQLNMYLLLNLLASEAELVEVQLAVLKESTIIRRQRRSTRSITGRLFHIWDRLIRKERSVRQTLRAASRVLTHPF